MRPHPLQGCCRSLRWNRYCTGGVQVERFSCGNFDRCEKNLNFTAHSILENLLFWDFYGNKRPVFEKICAVQKMHHYTVFLAADSNSHESYIDYSFCSAGNSGPKDLQFPILHLLQVTQRRAETLSFQMSNFTSPYLLGEGEMLFSDIVMKNKRNIEGVFFT